MGIDQATDVVQEALKVMLTLSIPILAAGLVIGLMISILQAVTQIQEQTLTFVPKIVGMGLVAIMITPWAATIMIEFARKMFGDLG